MTYLVTFSDESGNLLREKTFDQWSGVGQGAEWCFQQYLSFEELGIGVRCLISRDGVRLHRIVSDRWIRFHFPNFGANESGSIPILAAVTMIAIFLPLAMMVSWMAEDRHMLSSARAYFGPECSLVRADSGTLYLEDDSCLPVLTLEQSCPYFEASGRTYEACDPYRQESEVQ